MLGKLGVIALLGTRDIQNSTKQKNIKISRENWICLQKSVCQSDWERK